jgi:hypothetical protein
MCTPASFVLTKDCVFFSKTSNSHEDIIEENHLVADGVRGPNILRVEIVPPDGDYALPISKWQYHTDQDILPEWAGDGEKRARAALKQWKRYHCLIRTAGDGSTLTAGYRSTLTAGNGSTLTAGNGSIFIIRWWNNGWHVVAREVTDNMANRLWQFNSGVWIMQPL